MGSTSASSGQTAGSVLAPPSVLVSIIGVLVSLTLTFIGLTAITFVISRVMPVDPVLAIVGDRAPQDVYDRVYLELGLDRPIWQQYLRYLGSLVLSLIHI